MRKRIWLICAAGISAALTAISVHPPSHYLIWNTTESAPKGLYLLKNSPLTPSGWAVLSANSPAAEWISDHGYLAADWPILKQVRAQSGDKICRDQDAVFINGKRVATALKSAPNGKILPNWTGCLTLNEDEVFLLNPHPRSLDGRYFGPTNLRDIEGSAALIWSANE